MAAPGVVSAAWPAHKHLENPDRGTDPCWAG